MGALQLSSIDSPKGFYEEGRWQAYCAHCGFLKRPQAVSEWEVHHVVAKQHCRLYGAPLHSPDDALRLCAKSARSCHALHTTHQILLPLACLRDENIAFAVHWLGAARAFVYLHRNYSGADPRLSALLEVA
jgi:hypothetical protein